MAIEPGPSPNFWYALSAGVGGLVILWNLILLASGKNRAGAVWNLGLAFMPLVVGVVLGVLCFRSDVSVDSAAPYTSVTAAGHASALIGIGLAASLIALTLAIIAFFVVSRRSYRIRG